MDFGGIVIPDDPEYQGEFSIPWKRNGERKRIRFRGWSGNDAIYHLNRGRRETMISVPLGVLLLHSRRASIIGGHRLNCASLPPPINHPRSQTNKQSCSLAEEKEPPLRRENWNELVSFPFSASTHSRALSKVNKLFFPHVLKSSHLFHSLPSVHIFILYIYTIKRLLLD